MCELKINDLTWHLNYCIIIWACTFKTNLVKLFKLQKRIIRICTKSPRLTKTKEMFTNYHILTVYSLHKLSVGKFMFSLNSNTLPNICNDMFNGNLLKHSYQTRNTNKFSYIPASTRWRENFITCVGPRLWKEIPQEIRLLSSISNFKCVYKLFLLQSQFWYPNSPCFSNCFFLD